MVYIAGLAIFSGLSLNLLLVFFEYFLPAFWRGFSEFFLFFPLSALVCMGLERLIERILPRIFSKFKGMRKSFSAITAYDGLVPASLIIIFIAAEAFTDVLVIALFFVLGNLTAMLTLNEISRKSSLERVPKFLRGTPLILVSMGLLSLISIFAAGIFLKILEVF
jgi:Na+-translocating ferredoxin:NAD+ oxidoreductase subunit A